MCVTVINRQRATHQPPPPPPLQALYVGSTLKFSLEQHHDVISTTFQRCSNVRCPLGRFTKIRRAKNVRTNFCERDCIWGAIGAWTVSLL